MPRTTLRRALAAPLAIAVLAGAAASADAATVAVSGDDGQPIPLAPGAPPALRVTNPSVGIGFPPGVDARFSVAIAGPDGVAVSTPVSCFLTMNLNRSIDYRGNGAYTVVVVNYAKNDTNCTTATSTEAYTFTIAAGAALAQPPGPFLIRDPGGYVTKTLNLPVSLNPGTISYEVRYAAGGVIGADGNISGPAKDGYVDRTTGTTPLRFDTPGNYVVIARVKSGAFYSPWSPPTTVRAIAPFDLKGNLRLPDARGPSYKFSGTVQEKLAAGGRINVAIARGTKGGKYKSLGSVKISSKGTFSKRFTERRAGTYRLRLRYKGSSLVAGGTIVQKFRITRRVVFG